MPQAKKKASTKKPAKKAVLTKPVKKIQAKKVEHKKVDKKAKAPGKPAATKKVMGKKVLKKEAPQTNPKAKPGAKPSIKVASQSAVHKPMVVERKPMANPIAAKRRTSIAADVNVPTDSILIKGFKPYVLTKNEDYMNKEQVEHFRKLLYAWKQELQDEVERTVHHMRDEAANFPDPNDRATQEAEFGLELRARDRERKLSKKIDESLLALNNGEYGFCESCGVEIGIRRLEARPTAAKCIDCKELDEIKEKQYG